MLIVYFIRGLLHAGSHSYVLSLVGPSPVDLWLLCMLTPKNNRNRGLDTVASRTLLAFMIAVFLMVTAGFVLGYLIDGEVIRAILIADDQPILQRVYGLPYVKRLAIIESIKVVIGFDPLSLIVRHTFQSIVFVKLMMTGCLQLLCGDIMVVWRAGVLCRERRIIMMVPLALLLCAACSFEFPRRFT